MSFLKLIFLFIAFSVVWLQFFQLTALLLFLSGIIAAAGVFLVSFLWIAVDIKSVVQDAVDPHNLEEDALGGDSHQWLLTALRWTLDMTEPIDCSAVENALCAAMGGIVRTEGQPPLKQLSPGGGWYAPIRVLELGISRTALRDVIVSAVEGSASPLPSPSAEPSSGPPDHSSPAVPRAPPSIPSTVDQTLTLEIEFLVTAPDGSLPAVADGVAPVVEDSSRVTTTRRNSLRSLRARPASRMGTGHRAPDSTVAASRGAAANTGAATTTATTTTTTRAFSHDDDASLGQFLRVRSPAASVVPTTAPSTLIAVEIGVPLRLFGMAALLPFTIKVEAMDVQVRTAFEFRCSAQGEFNLSVWLCSVPTVDINASIALGRRARWVIPVGVLVSGLLRLFSKRIVSPHKVLLGSTTAAELQRLLASLSGSTSSVPKGDLAVERDTKEDSGIPAVEGVQYLREMSVSR